jgi:hypothetical protein
MENFDIFICCGGKCGGTTLAYTFHQNGYKTTHLHSSKHLGNFKSSIDVNHTFDIINASKQQGPIYIIDSYRTPVERKISCFFQKIHTYLPNHENMPIQNVIQYFNEKILFSSVGEHHSINEFLQNYNMPLFHKFNFKRQYNISNKENITFVKVLFSDISEWDKILSQVLNKEIIIHKANLTEDKSINTLYTQFKESYRLPKAYLSKIENDDEFKIYTSAYNQKKYLTKWTKLSV